MANGIKNFKISNKAIALFLASSLAIASSSLFKSSDTRAESLGEYIMQNDYVKTTSKVNMRNDHNYFGEIICSIKSNEMLERILSCDDWSLVIYKDKIGFVSDNYTKDVDGVSGDSKIKQKDGYVSARTGINLRLGPGMNEKVIGSLGIGEIAEVWGITDNNWYLVSYNGKIGYVSSEYVDYSDSFEFSKNSDGKIYAYTTANVNFREEATKNSDKICLLNKGTPVEVLGQSDNKWFMVSYNGTIGYISPEYITFNPEGYYRADFIKVVYATDDIGMSNLKDNDDYFIYNISKYETCEVLAELPGKYYVRAGGCLGYILKDKTATLYNTFVVVDISSQKLTLYHNNEIIVETNIVTGQQYEYDTPTGIYSIRKKTTDTFLTGEDYFTHVDYWMPFNGGIGLHDASWRRKFGGTIYEKDGSHGCVNIPPEYADDVFYNVDNGTKVLVQK